MDEETTTQNEGDLMTGVMCKQLETGLQARQPRFDKIQKNEDMYNGYNPPALKGRSNINFDSVVMGGFVDSLLSSIDEAVVVKFGRNREQDKRAADKMQAVWDRESSPQKAAWDDKVLDSKKLASLSGRGFFKLFCTSVPKFATDLTTPDHYDMVTEPQGGADLDNHLFKFQMNIFRTKEDLLQGVHDGYYDKVQVAKLIQKYANPDLFKINTDTFKNKNARYKAFGIDIEMQSYVGQNLYRLVEGVVNYKGKWWYSVFSYETKTWIRREPLENVFSWAKEYPGRGPWTSWATHRDPFIFWSKAPADDIRPVAYTMKKSVNLMIDNLEKRNWDMKAYNPKVFTDPSALLYKQDGIARANLPAGGDIRTSIMQFQTPDTVGVTINVIEWLNSFIASKTGITPEASGQAKTDKVGITFSNIQQTAKRMKLTNKMFKKSLSDLAVMFDYGVWDNLRGDYAVKILGPNGVEWEEVVTRQDTDRDFSIHVKAGDEDEARDILSAQKKEASMQNIIKDPDIRRNFNPKWLSRAIMDMGGWSEEEQRVAMDVNNDANSDILARAAQAIDDCLNGKTPKVYRGATDGFIQKILDYIYNHDVSEEEFNKLTDYAKAHVPIAKENMMRMAKSAVASQGLTAGMVPTGAPTAPAVPTPSTIPVNNSDFAYGKQ